HMPAKMFRETIARLNSYYLYGLTATPMRKNNDEVLILYIGRIARTDKLPVLFDYRDMKIDYLEKLFKKRNSYYEKIRKANQMTLEI
ncbi:MAG: hypothetical protein WD267_06625, partial [Balneolales bacterium]